MLLTPFTLKIGDDLIQFLAKSKFQFDGEFPSPYLVDQDEEFINPDILDGFNFYEQAEKYSSGNYYKCGHGLVVEVTPFDEESIREFLLSVKPTYNNWRQLNICTGDNEYIVMYDKDFVIMNIDSFFYE